MVYSCFPLKVFLMQSTISKNINQASNENYWMRIWSKWNHYTGSTPLDIKQFLAKSIYLPDRKIIFWHENKERAIRIEKKAFGNFVNDVFHVELGPYLHYKNALISIDCVLYSTCIFCFMMIWHKIQSECIFWRMSKKFTLHVIS